MNMRTARPRYRRRRRGEDPTGIRMMFKVLAGMLAAAVGCAGILSVLL